MEQAAYGSDSHKPMSSRGVLSRWLKADFPYESAQPALRLYESFFLHILFRINEYTYKFICTMTLLCSVSN